MLTSVTTLTNAQVARSLGSPGQPTAAPAAAAFLELFRQRNTALDAMFYDVSKVSDEETARIAPHLAAEGAILVVPPSGEGPLTLCNSTDDLAQAAPDISVLAVAGVGSSALGTAAFARNVADAVGKPVAGIVSGYGLADLLTEAMGGFFWFGALNGMRHAFEGLDRLTETGTVDPPAKTRSMVNPATRSKDTQTVVSLLEDARFNFTVATGHSKGNLVVSEALYQIRRINRPRFDALAEGLKVITISAIIAMPPGTSGVIDVIGEWDNFGRFNSRTAIEPDLIVPRAWHHTNTELPAHLAVTEHFARAMALG